MFGKRQSRKENRVDLSEGRGNSGEALENHEWTPEALVSNIFHYCQPESKHSLNRMTASQNFSLSNCAGVTSLGQKRKCSPISNNPRLLSSMPATVDCNNRSAV